MSLLLLFTVLCGITVEKTEYSPLIDGVINDLCWQNTPSVGGEFTAFRPRTDVPMSLPTDIRISYDEEFVYVCAFMHDPDPSRIVHQVGARDNDQPVDKFYIYLDTFNDNANCFVFVVTVDGVQLDYRITEVGGYDMNWDAVWSSAAAVSDSGWTAELAIPFSVLRYSSDQEQTWGVNFGRTISYSNEGGYLCRMKQRGDVDVSCFADLTGLYNLPSRHRVEVRPFVAGRLQFSTKETVLSHPWGSAGVDLKVPFTMQSVLDVTVFPDFGQIESDADQGNISHWAPWLREKRPFFMEGTEIFEMPFNMFYSRNIGSVAMNGELIPILGGAKVTGTSGKLRYGFLEVVTDRVWEGDTVLVEPSASYGAGSLLEEFSPGNWMKVSMTSVDVPGQEGEDYVFGRSASFSGMTTVREYFEFKGKLGLTWNRFQEQSENAAFKVEAGYNREYFDMSLSARKSGDNFNPSFMGYMQGNGVTSYSFDTDISRDFESGFIDGVWLGLGSSYSMDSSHRNTGSGVNMWFGGSTVSRYHMNCWVSYNDRSFDRYEGPDGRWYNGGFSGGVSLSTDFRKPVAGWANASRSIYLDSWTRRFSTGLMIKPTPVLSFDIGPSMRIQRPATSFNWSEQIWEHTFSDWKSLSITASYMVTPLMRIRLNGQMSRFERVWDTESSSSLSDNIWANLLYSWEYLPGSWFHFLIGEVSEDEEDPEFTVYAKVSRFF
ncbi:MAG: carbohydrate binding family 9 domain-containing protein [Candidatus Fermentibacteraceae bacterium]|nr:carbohydrate binding family 9 domain-containing protein [Candidatus Fermentibacteraceae bacterium]